MCAIDAAVYLDADHAVAGVAGLPDEGALDRLGEAWPAGAAVELVAGIEQRRIGADREVDAIGLVVPILVAERRLGALLTGDAVLLGREHLAPLGVGALHAGLAHVDHDIRGQPAGGNFTGFTVECVLGHGRGF